MTGRTALIAGATGLVGTECLGRLLEDRRYASIISVGRRLLDIRHPKLHQVVTSFENWAQLDSDPTVHDVFCCLGTTIRKAGTRAAFRRVDFEYPLTLAEVGRRHGASQFLLVSSLGADPTSRNFYLRTKGQVEVDLQALHYETLLIVRPSILLGRRRELRLGEAAGKVLLKGLSPVLRGPLSKYRPVLASHVATCLVRAASLGLLGTHVFESNRIRALVEQPLRRDVRQ